MALRLSGLQRPPAPALP